MKKLAIFVSFTSQQKDFVSEKLKNHTSKEEYLGFWSDVDFKEKEKLAEHIASTVNYFLDTDKEEVYFGCDESDLDRILSKIKTDAFDVNIITGEKFKISTDI